MQKQIPLILLLLVLIYALYTTTHRENTSHRYTKQNAKYIKHLQEHQTSHYLDELNNIDTESYTKQYIVDVINHGSDSLGFKGGVMEAGFASPEDAEKIACYVLTLSGKKCNTPYPKDAEMFYTSICGGCHGDDGKGLGGNYPDLTKKKLLGIQAREYFLKSMLKAETIH